MIFAKKNKEVQPRKYSAMQDYVTAAIRLNFNITSNNLHEPFKFSEYFLNKYLEAVLYNQKNR